ncbi:hypothetical protein [Silvimonas soli]|uniref:hypothetical protein n=1 Tax=Silvimonas soli TaxID=2980100 RepID=UPI0024B39B17|nr:hypothetical protein [Silvimonas soli]
MRLDPRQVALTLSDLESGTPRQWYWLEIAALHPKAEQASSRFGLALLRRFGPAVCWRLLQQSGVDGTALYAPQVQTLQRRSRQTLQDAALFTATLPLLLAGFQRLPATITFVLWLGVFLGSVWQAGAVLRQIQPPAIAEPINDDEVLDEEAGPEDVVGLQAMLVAVGISVQQAGQLITQLHTDPVLALPALNTLLPNLPPPPPGRREHLLVALRAWLTVLLPVTLAFGWLPLLAGLALCVVWSSAIIWLSGRHRAAPLVVASGLMSYGFGRLCHWL